MTAEEIMELKDRVEQASKRSSELHGSLESQKEQLRQLGYDSIKKASEALEKMDQRLEEQELEIQEMEKELEDLLEEIEGDD